MKTKIEPARRRSAQVRASVEARDRARASSLASFMRKQAERDRSTYEEIEESTAKMLFYALSMGRGMERRRIQGATRRRTK